MNTKRAGPLRRTLRALLCLAVTAAAFWTGLFTMSRWDALWSGGDYISSYSVYGPLQRYSHQAEELERLCLKQRWDGALNYADQQRLEQLKKNLSPAATNYRFEIHDQSGTLLYSNLPDGESMDSAAAVQLSENTLTQGEDLRGSDYVIYESDTGRNILMACTGGTEDAFVRCDPAETPGWYNRYGWLSDGEDWLEYHSDRDSRVQTASVTLDSTFETLNGTVSKISAVDTVLSGNRIVREVTIDVSNPGGISTSQSASAEIAGVGSSSGGTFAYADEAAVTAKISGEVASLRVSEGDRVDKDQLLLVLSSDTLADEIQSASESLRSAQLSLESQYEQLADYTITSPISGTIIDKNYKAGETSESNQVLCSIYDLSYLTMTLSVDELDITSVEVGQNVELAMDAITDHTYAGTVSKISQIGTATSGVTVYDVTLTIDGDDQLKLGMNGTATILVEERENVLLVPIAALNTSRGESYVWLKSDSAADGEPGVRTTVETGLSDENYAEVLSGLSEGDVVLITREASTSTTDSRENGMGGMMMDMGGGMPGGSFDGGMPSGGGAPAGGGRTRGN